MKKIILEITKEKDIYLVKYTNKTSGWLYIHKSIFGVLLNIFKKLKKLEETNYGT